METQKVVERMHATIPRCEGLSLKEYGLLVRLHKWGGIKFIINLLKELINLDVLTMIRLTKHFN